MSKPKIVLVGGCFDILHYGHIYFLKKAKALGNVLIVAIESDKRVRELKGEDRPIHSQEQRKEVLESLKFVDKVIILKDKMTDKDYLYFVKQIKPTVIAVTRGDPILEKKLAQAKASGAKLVKIPKIKSPSTSQILNTIHTLKG
ncbi:MAG: D-glycero-beta-D-manno-heptose 1-phosphate adenylyltransferase [Patescibacteria group bacterium]|nr:D-glycero-beta-D-manno-heptose 1-phosphate adenylyltransferase [Patescibacteria group bacterium]